VSEFADRLSTILDGHVSLGSTQMAQLERHFDLLQRWNRQLNLTAVRDEAEAIERHYAESVYFAHLFGRYLEEINSRPDLTVADIGSGAGFPGFVLAVLEPNWTVTLIDSHRRKAVFLSEAGRELGNVHVIAGRAEQVVAKFDAVVSRAVRPEDVLELVPHLGRVVGILVSSAQARELAAAPMRWDIATELPWAPARLVLAGVPRGTTASSHV
jgi:16S rRNA (guanine527-N7)-methyltransferase